MNNLTYLYQLEEEKLTKKYIENNLWNSKTNISYDNIFDDQVTDVKINSQLDLIVHKVTNNDKIGLIDEYNNIISTMKKDDDEINIFFAKTKKQSNEKKIHKIKVTKVKKI